MGGEERDGMGKVKGTFWIVAFPPDKGVCWRWGIKFLPSSDPGDLRFLSNYKETKEQFCHRRQARLVQCTSPEFSRASCLAARRPQVSFNCVSNWLLPMQLLPCHTQYFTAPGKGQEGLLFEGRHSYCHICEPLMWIVGRHMLNWSPERLSVVVGC